MKVSEIFKDDERFSKGSKDNEKSLSKARDLDDREQVLHGKTGILVHAIRWFTESCL